jgi:hypothetical protein
MTLAFLFSSLGVRDCDPPKVFHPVGRPAFTNTGARCRIKVQKKKNLGITGASPEVGRGALIASSYAANPAP